MAGNVTESTMKFKVDISDLKSNMKAAQREIKVANSEFKAATASMDDWSSSADGLSAKITQQQKVLNAQKGILNSLKAQYKQVVEEQGANSKAAQDLEIKINNQKATVIKAQKELGNFKDALEEIENASDGTEGSLDDVDKALKDVKDSADDASDASDGMGDGFTVAKGALASLVADGIRSFISGIATAIEETKEFRKEMSLLQEVADENEVAFDKAKEAYKNLLATSGDEGASTEALNNLLTAGFDEKNLDEIVAGVEGLAIRFKDTLKQEGIADSIQEWIGSNGESLTGNFAEALERMGYNLEDVTAKTKGMTKEQREQWVINTLNKEGLNELSASYRENNKDAIAASNAQFELTSAISNFAAIAEPVVTAVKGGFAELLNTLFGMSSIDLSPLTNGIKTVFDTISGLLTGELSITDFISNLSNGLQEGIPQFVSKGLEMLDGFITMIAENAPRFIESGISFIKNLVKGLMDSLPELISKVPEIISKFANIINDNAPTIIMAGVGIIKDIIVGLFKAIPTLIASIPKIITAIIDVWTAFNWVNLGKNAITFMKNGITSMYGAVKTAGTGVKDAIVNIIKNLPNTLKSYATNMMTNFSGTISSAIGTVRSYATNIFNAVVNGVKGLPSKLLEIGKDLVRGLWNGISDMTGWVLDKIQGFGSSVLNGIKDFFDINSPSRETAWIGEMLGEGLGNGIVDSIKSAVSSAQQMASEVLDTLHGELDEINIDPNLSGNVRSNIRTLNGGSASGSIGRLGGRSQTVNFNQTINSPKALDRLTIYRQTNSLVFSAKERLKHA